MSEPEKLKSNEVLDRLRSGFREMFTSLLTEITSQAVAVKTGVEGRLKTRLADLLWDYFLEVHCHGVLFAFEDVEGARAGFGFASGDVPEPLPDSDMWAINLASATNEEICEMLVKEIANQAEDSMCMIENKFQEMMLKVDTRVNQVYWRAYKGVILMELARCSPYLLVSDPLGRSIPDQGESRESRARREIPVSRAFKVKKVTPATRVCLVLTASPANRVRLVPTR